MQGSSDAGESDEGRSERRSGRLTSSPSKRGGGENMVAELTSVEMKDDVLEVEFDSRHTFRLPYIWLRDSCSRAFDPKTGDRLFSVAYQGPHMPAGSLAAMQDASAAVDAGIERRAAGYNGLVVIWSSGLESRYEAGWLMGRCVGTRAPPARGLAGPERRAWGVAEMSGKVPTFAFREVTGDDKAVLQLLEAVAERDGVAVISGVPCRLGSIGDIGRRVFGCSTVSHPFQHKVGSEDDGYGGRMSGERALHSELAYCGDSPGIMTLLCVRGGGAEKERAGGDMVLVDGLMLARRLEEGYAEEYSVLSSNAVTFRKSGYAPSQECELVCARPAITLDCAGDVRRVCIDEQHRARWESDAGVGGAVLRAMQAALGVLHSESLVVPLPLAAGDMLVMDASRVLWGQAPFASGGGGGVYEAGFVSADDALSRARLLRRLMPEK